MKAIAMLLVVCAACRGDDVELYPINPGGGGVPGGQFVRDASQGGGDGGNVMLSGRVCLINDARNPTTCAATGAGGLSVRLNNQGATTASDGSFMITVLNGTDNVWRVSGNGVVPSAMAVGANGNVIPALDTNIYASMVTANNAAFAGTGAIVAKLTTNNAALMAATATAVPAPAGNVFYDGTDIVTWDQTATGMFGVVWVPGITPGTATLTVTTAPLQTQTQIMGIPLFADTITYVFAAVP